MQSAGIAALGLNWRYLAFEVQPEKLREALAGAQAMRFVGINLTVPHKLFALEIADVVDDAARAWGAVNTIVFEARDADEQWKPLRCFLDRIPDELRLHRYNTDADAIVQSIREDLRLESAGVRVLLLGEGGAGWDGYAFGRRGAALRPWQPAVGEQRYRFPLCGEPMTASNRGPNQPNQTRSEERTGQ